MCGFVFNRFCIYLYSTVFNHNHKADFDDEMRVAYGIFLIGIVLIVLLASTMLLLFPDASEGHLLPLIKLAIGIWIIKSIYELFGHTLF
jgi:hypothetical protein